MDKTKDVPWWIPLLVILLAMATGMGLAEVLQLP